jgi:hypothetical protein
MEEAGEEEKGRGALGLGTSSKLLELDVKGTLGGGMAERLPCSYGFLRGGWGLAKAKKPCKLLKVNFIILIKSTIII